MENAERTPGIGIICDSHGHVIEIIRDDLSICQKLRPGDPFTFIVDRGNREKALNFMVELGTQGAAFDWQINVRVNGKIKTLHFAGVASTDNILIVAALNSNGVMKLYEEMMRISNEQVNELRMAVKERTEMAREHTQRDRLLYDELSRLNNELSNLQRELTKKNMELEWLNEQKNRFLGMAAHDLRNPLGAIQMYSEFLRDEAADALDETQMEFISIIHGTSEFMLQMVNDLLDLAKIESGKLELEPEYTDIVELAKKNVQLNSPLARRKKIDLKLVSEPGPVEIFIDGAKIAQVFQNLITNAIKFSYPDSTITVGVENGENEILLSVKDQGQGIPEDQRDKLFEPFQKTSVKTTGGEESTGLGLAIVRKIVDGHGGRIWVESEVGKGSTFFVSLPMGE